MDIIVVDDSSSCNEIYLSIHYIKYSTESENVCLWDNLCKFCKYELVFVELSYFSCTVLIAS